MLKPLSLFKSNSTKFLLIGYILLIALFSVLLLIDSNIHKEQIQIINSSEVSTIKMKTIVDLIEIARRRVALSHTMISAEDVFDKDEISQNISGMGTQFIFKYSALLKMQLSHDEQNILKSLEPKFEVARQKLRIVSELALEDSPETDEKARNTVLDEIVPLQQVIIDGFMQILGDIQQNIQEQRISALENYSKSKEYRHIIIALILLASMLVIIWVLKRLTSIENELYSLSLVDGLTGIANRRSFDQHLNMVWGNCMRQKQPISLLLIDIDYFKNYNDSYGHQKGDDCLIKIASIIKATARRSQDLAARYGGEEFALVLPNDNEQDALHLAKQLINMVNKENIPHETSGITDHVTISVGLATITPPIEMNYLQLIKKADQNLYLSKENGRNQVTAIISNA